MYVEHTTFYWYQFISAILAKIYGRNEQRRKKATKHDEQHQQQQPERMRMGKWEKWTQKKEIIL